MEGVKGVGREGTALKQNDTYGSGAIAVVSPTNSNVAPTVPRARYICLANKGNAAANDVRIVVLHARALAAIGLYATTMYVKEDVKMKYVPVPNGTDASTGTIQCTPRRVERASQRSASGTSTPPTCPITRRNSAGGSRPCSSLYLRCFRFQ